MLLYLIDKVLFESLGIRAELVELAVTIRGVITFVRVLIASISISTVTG